MEERILANAELVRSFASERFGIIVEYNEAGVCWLNQFIDGQRVEAAETTKEKLPSTLGSYLGECIRRSYGGKWIQDKEGNWAVQVNERITAYPFNKVRKQLASSEGESVFGLFIAIPALLKNFAPVAPQPVSPNADERP